MNIVNLTPHPVNFVAADGTPVRTVDASGKLARVVAKTVTVGDVDGIPVTATDFGDVEGLPDPTPGTIFVVSSLVAQRVSDRDDVFVPNQAVRDASGRIIGCQSLARV